MGIKSETASNSATGPFIINNLVYDNTVAAPRGATAPTSYGIWLLGGNATQITNNTVYQPTGDALHIDAFEGLTATGIQVENNIFWTQNGYDIVLAPSSENWFQERLQRSYFLPAAGAASAYGKNVSTK